MRPLTQTVSSQATGAPLPTSSQNGQFGYGVGVTITGTLTATVEYTFDDPEANYATDFATDANWFSDIDLTDIVSSTSGNIIVPVSAIRLDVTAYTSGSAVLVALAAN